MSTAIAYEVSEPTVQRTIVKIEGALLACGGFALPGKKALRQSELAIEVVVVDATEVTIERPQKQKRAYNGKKKRPTQKAQVIVRKSDQRRLCTAFATGKTHDFALFKDSRLPLLPTTTCLADNGYKGLQKLHQNARTPHKKSKHHPLTVQQKRENRLLGQQRLVVEHVLCWLKRFDILCGPYPNKGKRFEIRFNLIAALYNAHLDL